MHHNLKFKLGLLILLIAGSGMQGQTEPRELSSLKAWRFTKGNPAGAHERNFDDSSWKKVSVPHDWAISGPFILDGDGNTGKLPWKGEGWYRQKIKLPSSYSDKNVYLIFDGVMAFPKVYVNGKLAGSWDYGYNSFYLDITELISPGKENVIAVHASTFDHDSRWYPGAGIYRKVQLLATGKVHVKVWGSHVMTPVVTSDRASVRITQSVLNRDKEASKISVVQLLLGPGGTKLASAEIEEVIDAESHKDIEFNLEVTDPERWDVDVPRLYSAVVEIYKNGHLADRVATPFGIRTIAFTPDDGFHLNGRRVQLKGVNLHHDQGILGAAFNKRAMQRQLEIMKSMGVNAIRNSHNVAAPELLELCDQMGLLMFNEIFDKYDAKADLLPGADFESFAHRNVRNFILRDRNHPSVFLWSVGNEIGDVQMNVNRGHHRLHTMVNFVKKYDPTRPVTLVSDNMESAKLRHFDYYDVNSWNYGRRYLPARQLEPNKSVVISESASTVSTRGFYELPLPEKKTDFTKSLQVSSYDLNAPAWAEIADDDFMWQEEDTYVAGEFVWTGFDYLGEPTPYHNHWALENGMSAQSASRSSYFGIVDLVGIPKDRYYLYKSYWKPDETTIHILPHWNWADRIGEKIPVFVYTNGDCAELFVNGKSQGKRCKNPASDTSTERFRLMWNEVRYQPGEVKAVAYKNGVKIVEKTLKTAGDPHEIKLNPDRAVIQSDGEDLSYVLLEAFDKEGNPCPLADNEISLQLSGDASIAGAGNGNPQSFDTLQDHKVKLFYGKAMVIIRSGEQKGKIKLVAKAEGLRSDSTIIEMK